MTSEAAYHEGYCKALQEVSRLVNNLQDTHPKELGSLLDVLDLSVEHVKELGSLLDVLDRKIERARCLCRSSLASGAAGNQGY